MCVGTFLRAGALSEHLDYRALAFRGACPLSLSGGLAGASLPPGPHPSWLSAVAAEFGVLWGFLPGAQSLGLLGTLGGALGSWGHLTHVPFSPQPMSSGCSCRTPVWPAPPYSPSLFR